MTRHPAMCVKQDLLYGLRQLRRTPGFSVPVTVSLALGVWLTTMLAALVVPLYWPRVPYRDAARLIEVAAAATPASGGAGSGMVNGLPKSLVSLLRKAPGFGDVAEYSVWQGSVDGDPEQLRIGLLVSPEFLRVLGVRPWLGRGFLRGDDASQHPTVVLDYDYWRRHYGADSAVIGTALDVDGGPSRTIVGVMPPDFTFPPDMRLDMYLSSGTSGTAPVAVIARLADGVSIAQARSEAGVIARRSEGDQPARGLELSPYRITSNNPDRLRAALFFGGAGLFVLMIVCANVANLLLVRGAARRQEMAVRIALGATRARIVRQLATEGTLLVLPGAVLGVALAAIQTRLLSSLIPDAAGPDAVGLRVYLVALAITAALVGVFTLVPTFVTSHRHLDSVLRQGSRHASGGASMARAMRALVTSSLALTIALVVGASIMGTLAVQSFLRGAAFDPSHVLAAQISALPQVSIDAQQAVTEIRFAAERAGTVPGVKRVALGPAPLALRVGPLRIATTESGNERRTRGFIAPVSGDYFDALGVQMVRGRSFSSDEIATRAPVVVVGMGTALREWQTVDVFGRRLRLTSGSESASTEFTVVGVVANVRDGTLSSPVTEAYVPFGRLPSRRATLLVRVNGEPRRWLSQLRRTLSDDAALRVTEVIPLADLSPSHAGSSMSAASLMAVIAVISLVLVAIGLYGVIAFAVAQRTNEIGIRMALGADARSVTMLMVREAARIAVIGGGFGCVCAVLIALALRGALGGPAIGMYPASAVALVIVGLVTAISTYVPARRAARLSPTAALRVI